MSGTDEAASGQNEEQNIEISGLVPYTEECLHSFEDAGGFNHEQRDLVASNLLGHGVSHNRVANLFRDNTSRTEFKWMIWVLCYSSTDKNKRLEGKDRRLRNAERRTQILAQHLNALKDTQASIAWEVMRKLLELDTANLDNKRIVMEAMHKLMELRKI